MPGEERARAVLTLRDVLGVLQRAYCGSVGYEYMHINDGDKRSWLRDRIEAAAGAEPGDAYGRERRLAMLEKLVWATRFESFAAAEYPTAKRYSLAGGESLIPAMEEMFSRAASLGVESVVVGMAHRGRLNFMVNVAGVPLSQVFRELSTGGLFMPVEVEGSEEETYAGTGEFYVLAGASRDRPTRGGGAGRSSLHLSVLANPSHLESVLPVVAGKTRAKQFYSGDGGRTRNMAVVVHGDGGFSGQGVVYETLNLGALPGYTAGGTVHIVVNNRIAFTTEPGAGRSSRYCTDVAKGLGAPVFHVNGDDPEAVVHVCELAAEWRQAFHSDVVVDLICYRRAGHNELDDPTFTQPVLCEVIKKHPSSVEIYEKKLLGTGQVTSEDVQMIHGRVDRILNEELAKSKSDEHLMANKRDYHWLSAQWAGMKSPDQVSRVRDTGVKPDVLRRVGPAITALPESLKPHRAVKEMFEQRRRAVTAERGEGIDWGFAEALAFATLLLEGYHVRLSGQDVQRGTFCHRHAVVHDQETRGESYCPLHHVVPDQNPEQFTVCNSLLSEYAALGFEIGYSMENPNSLVLWEAQFGDFANLAQVMIDQFLSCAEAKWLRQSGLVLLLPHGYDGLGPEHSSAYLERFLQMSDDNPFVIPEMEPTLCKQIQECNWQVVNLTTPANYFHALRRQIHREFRKPLIVMAPKNLLRHKDFRSSLSEFDEIQDHPGLDDEEGSRFKRLIPDHHKQVEKGINRFILCSGQVYFQLDEGRKQSGRSDVAICRIEQLCPFPYDLVQRELKRYPNAEIVWCQEEPINRGAYSYIAPRLTTCLRALGRGSFEDIKYVGRAPSAAAATGFPSVHVQEQSELVKKALQVEPIKLP
ncbi:2-oxoglutarate dehydrogenase, mitochondrial-like [Panicum virgatum]|nr:2-oxoglutarate dehydrogenase, mitochondrial-like [Panicum virgatum]